MRRVISFDNFLTIRWHLVIKSYIISRWKKKSPNFHPILNSSSLNDNRITSIFLVKLINNLNRDFANFIKRAEKEKIQLKDDRNQTSEAMNLNEIRRIKKN